jgi:endonuclease/exonuclease/phosphatase family metal-dependent hydrolase
MKLVSWILAGGDKRGAVARLDADVVMLQERRRRDVEGGELWAGASNAKGLSLRTSIECAPLDCAEPVAQYFVPYEVRGAEPFQLIHVWAMNVGADRYVRGLVRSVRCWRDRIASRPTVIAGDFNANAYWDHENPADLNYSALAAMLDELGLVSAYHAFFGEMPSHESRPTFYLYRHADKPAHLDYCFIPRAWLPRLKRVTVGEHAEWSRFSDHMPVWVEIE